MLLATTRSNAVNSTAVCCTKPTIAFKFNSHTHNTATSKSSHKIAKLKLAQHNIKIKRIHTRNSRQHRHAQRCQRSIRHHSAIYNTQTRSTSESEQSVHQRCKSSNKHSIIVQLKTYKLVIPQFRVFRQCRADSLSVSKLLLIQIAFKFKRATTTNENSHNNRNQHATHVKISTTKCCVAHPLKLVTSSMLRVASRALLNT